MKKHLVTFLVGALGVLVALGAFHLYVDHQNLHALVALVQQSQAQQAQKPAPPPTGK